MKPNDIKIWTDGSACNYNHNKGGYGIVILNGELKTFCGGSYTNTTSARMEILALVRALRHCTPGDNVIVHIDNQYVVNTVAKGWIFKWKHSLKERKNMDLWDQFLTQYDRLNRKVKLKWVRGHNNDPMNELADQLAKRGAHKKSIFNDR